jgi:hypothetical protein
MASRGPDLATTCVSVLVSRTTLQQCSRALAGALRSGPSTAQLEMTDLFIRPVIVKSGNDPNNWCDRDGRSFNHEGSFLHLHLFHLRLSHRCLWQEKPTMRHSRILRKLTDSSFGKFDLLRPPKIRKTGPSTVFTPPSPVPSHIRPPSYVPVNFFTRPNGDEPLADAPPDELEGYHGEDGVGNARIGMIALGGDEERGVRYSGGLVAQMLEQVKDMVKVSMCAMLFCRWLTRLGVARNHYRIARQAHTRFDHLS